jgi:hypothetical protein
VTGWLRYRCFGSKSTLHESWRVPGLAALNHPTIVAVFDVREVPYYGSELGRCRLVPGELLIRDITASDPRCCCARSGHSFHSSHRNVRPAPRSRRHTFRGGGVGPRQAANSIPQPFAAALTQSTRLRSPRRRFVCSQDSPHSPDLLSDRTTGKRPNTIR